MFTKFGFRYSLYTKLLTFTYWKAEERVQEESQVKGCPNVPLEL